MKHVTNPTRHCWSNTLAGLYKQFTLNYDVLPIVVSSLPRKQAGYSLAAFPRYDCSCSLQVVKLLVVIETVVCVLASLPITQILSTGAVVVQFLAQLCARAVWLIQCKAANWTVKCTFINATPVHCYVHVSYPPVFSLTYGGEYKKCGPYWPVGG